jgi:hypothetical protein
VIADKGFLNMRKGITDYLESGKDFLREERRYGRGKNGECDLYCPLRAG